MSFTRTGTVTACIISGFSAGIDLHPLDFHPNPGPAACLDLRTCSKLEQLDVLVGLDFLADEASFSALGEILRSWHPETATRFVSLQAYSALELSRGQFVELVRGVGLIMDRSFGDTADASNVESGEIGSYNACRVFLEVRLCDREVWRHWWRAELHRCVEKLAKPDALRIKYSLRK